MQRFKRNNWWMPKLLKTPATIYIKCTSITNEEAWKNTNVTTSTSLKCTPLCTTGTNTNCDFIWILFYSRVFQPPYPSIWRCFKFRHQHIRASAPRCGRSTCSPRCPAGGGHVGTVVYQDGRCNPSQDPSFGRLMNIWILYGYKSSKVYFIAIILL